MGVTQSRIVWYEGKIQILYVTSYGYFISSNGAFSQRDTYIKPINGEEVKVVLEQTQEYFNIPEKQM